MEHVLQIMKEEEEEEASSDNSSSPNLDIGKVRMESFDCDSDELEALEEAADEEETDDEEEMNKEIDLAVLLYPVERVAELLEELKQEGLFAFLQAHVVGKTEREIKALFIALGVLLPNSLRRGNLTPEFLISILKTVLIRHLRQRQKLDQYNTIDDAVNLIGKSKKILVLSGSGISTSVGIPDFRSKDGIYAQLQREGKYNLADPQEMFDKDFFLHDPSCFFSFAKSIFPSNFAPSPSHRFIKLLEDKGCLLRNYTQNIDTLEEASGIEKVLYCHGSFSQAQCTTPGCEYKVAGSAIKADIFAQRVPYCPKCAEVLEKKKQAIQKKKKVKKAKDWEKESGDDEDEDDDDGLRGLGVIKLCITFFGENLSDEFDRSLLLDRSEVDLLIVMGTSLKVAPVSELVIHIPHRTPVILINKTPIYHMGLDIQLLGDSDNIVQYICNRLQWSLPTPEPNKSVVGGQSVAQDIAGDEVQVPEVEETQSKRVLDSHFWLFPGAEADGLVEALKRHEEDYGSSSGEKQEEEVNQPTSENKEIGRRLKRSASIEQANINKHQRHV